MINKIVWLAVFLFLLIITVSAFYATTKFLLVSYSMLFIGWCFIKFNIQLAKH